MVTIQIQGLLKSEVRQTLIGVVVVVVVFVVVVVVEGQGGILP